MHNPYGVISNLFDETIAIPTCIYYQAHKWFPRNHRVPSMFQSVCIGVALSDPGKLKCMCIPLITVAVYS